MGLIVSIDRFRNRLQNHWNGCAVYKNRELLDLHPNQVSSLFLRIDVLYHERSSISFAVCRSNDPRATMAEQFPRPTKTYRASTYPAISPTRPELKLYGQTVLITGGGMAR